MSNFVTVMKPFAKVLTVTTGTEEENIKLNDTEGNPVDCNYMILTYAGNATGSAAKGFVYVRPDSAGYAVIDNSVTGNTDITEEAGMGGFVSNADTPIIIEMPEGETFTAIAISHDLPADATFSLTYGHRDLKFAGDTNLVGKRRGN